MKKFLSIIFVLVISNSNIYAQDVNANTVDIRVGEANAIRFNGGISAYSIRFANSSLFKYGPVSGSSIKFSNSSSGGNGWVFGPHGGAPVAAISVDGRMQLKSNFVTLGRLGIGSTSLSAQANIFGGSGWYTLPTLSLRSNSSVHAWSLIDLKGGGYDQTPDYMIGRGTSSLYGGRSLTIHVPSRYGFYNNQGYYPRIVFASSGPNILGYAVAETGQWYFKGDVGVGTESTSAKLHISSSDQDILRIQSNKGGTGNQAGIDFCTYQNNTHKVARIAAEDRGGWSGDLVFFTSSYVNGGDDNVTERMRITTTGAVGIGTSDVKQGYQLAVKGKAVMEEIKVVVDANNFPDYVFQEDYKLSSLAETEAYIKKNKHLPEVPSAKEVEENGGVNLKEMNILLLKKLEELTLHVIDLQKQVDQLRID